MAEHTLGPWRTFHADSNHPRGYVLGIERDADGFDPVATVIPRADVEEANARLIAAAPRLYDYVRVAADTDATALDLLRELGLE